MQPTHHCAIRIVTAPPPPWLQVYWPAFCLAAGLQVGPLLSPGIDPRESPLTQLCVLQPPRRVHAHAHWLIGGSKMSKSSGNVVDPAALLEDYGVDRTR